eukprot:1643960-Pleurochrysis_carterae.AAC.1
MRCALTQRCTATQIPIGRHDIPHPAGYSCTDARPFCGLRKSSPLSRYHRAKPKSSPPPRPPKR